ncbi:MAG TPA: arginine--tRNA ligase [Candidatus Angelobacter sp.]
MYLELQQQLIGRVRDLLKQQYDVELPRIVVDQPPNVGLGEYALPLSFELAKKLRKAPKKIAEEVVAALGQVPGFEKFEVAGAGYINAKLNREEAAKLLLSDGARQGSATGKKILVEHTSINPNKAAHIGHLRNAILGDTFVRLLQAAGAKVDVQNYIDNTGVQVADVVVGFLYLEGKNKEDVERLIKESNSGGKRFDYYCWDLYARVSQWYEENPENKKARLQTLHDLEHGPDEVGKVSELISAALTNNLRRMLDITVLNDEERDRFSRELIEFPQKVPDLLVGLLYMEQKSLDEIEALVSKIEQDGSFYAYCTRLYAQVLQWYAEDREREKIQVQIKQDIGHADNRAAEMGAIISNAIIRRHLETMQRLDIEYDFLPQESEILHLHFWDLAFEQMKQKTVLYFETEGKNKGCWVMKRAGTKPAAEKTEEEKEGPDEDAKVIVRSNNTVTYVGKDIAYHLWKFGLLGRDFGYQHFYRYPDGRQVWISAETGEANHPHFGGVNAIYNVIDSRQADPQNNVIEAIRGLGHAEQAENYHHFSYEMVALTPRCAMDLGYEVSEEDQKRAYIEVSGRKGFGVKADDLLDSLIAAAQKEVDTRHAEMPEPERREIATQIAIGALRYFMLKFTKGTVIAFDLKEALSFEGETGPYAQYAIVRSTNIFRKASLSVEEILAGQTDLRFLKEDDELWELWLSAGQLSSIVEQCISTTEPAYAAKYAFQLAQQFNNFYHKHHILTETDEAKKRFLLTTAAVVRRSLIQSLELMGIGAPSVM